jgi:histidine triad (HIT) family protein
MIDILLIMDCVFCNIVSGKIPAVKLYEDDDVIAFPDANPKAPVHILIIPKKHIQSLNQISENELFLLGKMIHGAQKVARDQGIFDSGYRLLINTGKEGGQVIQHLHLHLLGGRQLRG